jgi:hypothetical protein
MPYKIWAKCPNCEKEANGLKSIDRLFGWRNINDKKIPQSHCRRCRTIK